MPSSLFMPTGIHGGRITEDFAHQDLHNEKVWRASSFGTPGAGSTYTVMFVTPSVATGKEISVVGSVSSNGPGILTFQQAPNATGGSAIIAYNGKMSSVLTADTVLTLDPTITSAGTIIETRFVGAAGFKADTGGTTISDVWLMKQATKYMIQFTADGASTRTVIKLAWHE